MTSTSEGSSRELPLQSPLNTSHADEPNTQSKHTPSLNSAELERQEDRQATEHTNSLESKYTTFTNLTSPSNDKDSPEHNVNFDVSPFLGNNNDLDQALSSDPSYPIFSQVDQQQSNNAYQSSVLRVEELEVSEKASGTRAAQRTAVEDGKGTRQRTAKVLFAVGNKLGSATTDQLDDSEFRRGIALDYPEIPVRRHARTFESERRQLEVVSPPRVGDKPNPVNGILRSLRHKFLENPEPIREDFSLRDAKWEEVPPDARLTKISRKLISPEALEAGKLLFETREDFLIVASGLSRYEFQFYVGLTEHIRSKYHLLHA